MCQFQDMEEKLCKLPLSVMELCNSHLHRNTQNSQWIILTEKKTLSWNFLAHETENFFADITYTLENKFPA